MTKRRDFLRLAGLTGVAMAQGAMLPIRAAETNPTPSTKGKQADQTISGAADENLNIIGPYGQWANGLRGDKLPSFSFRRTEFTDVDKWRKTARQRVADRLAAPSTTGPLPKVVVNKKYEYDGLSIEELSWQLPYGRPTQAILLKPANSKGKLPAILGLHDHAANKYFGKDKITKLSDDQHPVMKAHQEHYYDGAAWANELAKKGFVVLVSDAFTFGSRRVHIDDVPVKQRNGLKEGSPDDAESIAAYNEWAADHESVMAKSLFCAGTTWPGVFYSEDKIALDILAARPEVDATKLGCCGLSGGGLRTTFLSGLDERIKCAVNVGFTTTWSDFLLNTAYTHTWMVYVPLLPNELEFPEIMGLRVPLPTLVLNDSEDQLYTLPEMKKAESVLKDVYAKAGVADKFKCSYYPGEHKFDRPMQKEAFAWMERWLKA